MFVEIQAWLPILPLRREKKGSVLVGCMFHLFYSFDAFDGMEAPEAVKRSNIAIHICTNVPSIE